MPTLGTQQPQLTPVARTTRHRRGTHHGVCRVPSRCQPNAATILLTPAVPKGGRMREGFPWVAYLIHIRGRPGMRCPQWVAHHPRTIACRVSLFPGFFVCAGTLLPSCSITTKCTVAALTAQAPSLAPTARACPPTSRRRSVQSVGMRVWLTLFSLLIPFYFPRQLVKRFYLRRPFWTRSRSQLSQLSSLLPPPIVCAFTFCRGENVVSPLAVDSHRTLCYYCSRPVLLIIVIVPR